MILAALVPASAASSLDAEPDRSSYNNAYTYNQTGQGVHAYDVTERTASASKTTM